MKKCRQCGETKSLNDFYRASGTRDGYRGECKTCSAAAKRARYLADRERYIARTKAWVAANRDRRRAYEEEYRSSGRKAVSDRKSHLKRTFGLSAEAYDEMLVRQKGGCAICGDASPVGSSLHVDHDHGDGHVRGLLCFRCNNGLGQFQEDPGLLDVAIEYLNNGLNPEVIDLIDRRVAELKVVRTAS